MKGLLEGDLVRLTAGNVASDLEFFVRITGDSEYLRLMDSDPAHPFSEKVIKEELEGEVSETRVQFIIRPLGRDRPIGFIDLGGIRHQHGEAWAGIGIGDPDFWGKGYGTDAMKVMLQYAFQELNLYRVTLNVFEYNTRAVRSYEKAGFVHEGREREAVLRDGRRWDVLYMGITRPDWERLDAR